MKVQHGSKLKYLSEKGVDILSPESIEIGNEVDIDRISGEGVVIYPGSRIFGDSTLILNNSKIGSEGPVTIDNCQIGTGVELGSGFFRESVFLAGASAGSGSHVREGTILEEEASIAHTVGLKQTILFPFVTLGSLINFCDCLMAGGTGKKNHSEVGSSYIHFNYTPNQDKATPSILGDVPRGVMLNQKPVFLGGQGGLAGPCRLEYGTVTAAGSIIRKDELKPGRLIMAGGGRGGSISYKPGGNMNIKRIIINNINYISNLIALRSWYDHVRRRLISQLFPGELLEGLLEKVDMGIDERIKRLGDFWDGQKENQDQAELKNKWPELEDYLFSMRTYEGRESCRHRLLEKIHSGIKKSGCLYLEVIFSLETGEIENGTGWLNEIVHDIVTKSSEIITIT